MLAQIETAFAQRAGSEERLRSFLSDASHELRTPLTSIQGYAELLRKDALRDQAARDRALARIEKEAARMGVLVGDLAVLAREDEGPDARADRVDLAAVVAEVVADARMIDGDPDHRTDVPGPVPVLGDRPARAARPQPGGNALTHTPAGTPMEVDVSVPTGTRPCSGGAGPRPGMTRNRSSHVFDRFYRGDTDRPSTAAPGLGLFIVATLARIFGGSASVDTAPGEDRRSRWCSRWPATPRSHGELTGQCNPSPQPTPTGRETGHRVAGTMLASIDRGTGPAALLLHGQPGSGASWDPLTDRLATEFRVLAPDRVGYGASAGEASWGRRQRRSAGRRFLRHRAPRPGHRGGPQLVGWCGRVLAARHRSLVQGLVLVGAACTADSVNALDRWLTVPVVGDALTVVGVVGIS